MRYKLKLVPDSEPNADGRWVELDTGSVAKRLPMACTWHEADKFFAAHVPKGEHMVQYTHVHTRKDPA
jgi:hypothetical protein